MRKTAEQEGIVISGVGVVSPWGLTHKDLVNAFLYGEKEFTKSRDDSCCEKVENFAAEELIGKNGLRYLNSATRYGIYAALQCLQSANLLNQKEKMGVIIGSHLGHLDMLEKMIGEILTEGSRALSPLSSPNGAPNVIASAIGSRTGGKALNATIHNGFTSGLDALIYGCQMLTDGRADFLLVGGAEGISPYYLQWLKAHGFKHVFEGAGLILVEKSATATARGKLPQSKVVGCYSRPWQGGDSVQQCIIRLLGKTGLQINQLDAVVCAGSFNRKKPEKVALDKLGYMGSRYYCRELIGEGLAVSGLFQIIFGLELLQKGAKLVLVHQYGIPGNCSAIILSQYENKCW